MNRPMSMQTPVSNGLLGTLLLVGGVAIVASLAVVLANLAREGHAAFGTSSDGVIWGLPVASYVFFVLSSTGLTFVASAAMVCGLRQYYPIAKRCLWLAIATLVAGFVSLGFELGHPLRMLWAIPAGMQLRSPLNWMGAFYLLYLVFLVLKFRRVSDGDWAGPASRTLGVASLVTVIVAHGTLGLAFGMIATRPLWFDGSLPIYFLLTAMLSGVAFAVLATYAAYGFERTRMPTPVQSLFARQMPGLFALTLGITLVALAARTITGLWSNQDGYQAFDRMVASPWFHLELWVGMVLPLALLVSGARRSSGAQVAAAALVLVALFIGRYEFIVEGQAVPVFKGAWAGEFAAYTPSATEVMITLLSAAIVVTLYAVGEKYLRLGESPVTDEEIAMEEAETLAHAALRARRPLAGSTAD